MGFIYYTIAHLFIAASTLVAPKKYNFKLLYKWSQIEYEFASEEERSEAIDNGTFRVGYAIPFDVQYAYNVETDLERVFVTAPRIGPGIPATLMTITNKKRNGNPVVRPWPHWSWHIDPEKCNHYRIISVYRVWVDDCNKLWVLDNGVIGVNLTCPPQILTFDLKTNRLINKYEVPHKHRGNVTLLATPVVEVESVKNNCENSWVYAADSDARSLLVYSAKQNTSWRVADHTFYPNPKFNLYTIAGKTFEVADGVIGLALSPTSDGKKRKLFYHAMSSATENWVYTRVLKNRINFLLPFGSSKLFHTYRNTRNQQSNAEATDKRGNLYFSLLIDVKLVVWNSRTSYNPDNFHVVSDDKNMQFPSGLKVNKNKDGKEMLWVMSNAYQKLATGSLYPNETNFRIYFSRI